MAHQIPFSWMLAMATLAVVLIPIILMWIILCVAIGENKVTTTIVVSVNSTTNTTVNTEVYGVSTSLQSMIINDTIVRLETQLADVEYVMDSVVAYLYSVGMNELYYGPAPGLAPKVSALLGSSVFSIVKGHPLFSFISVEGAYANPGEAYGSMAFWVVTQALGYDLQADAPQRTLYTVTLDPIDTSTLSMDLYVIDQVTGAPLVSAFNMKRGIFGKYQEEQTAWLNDIAFNPYNGLAELYLESRPFPALNRSWFDTTIAIAARSVTDMLKQQVAPFPLDRLFVFFRTVEGTLLGASSGKWYSHSDVDVSDKNPLLEENRVDTTKLVRYTCLNSTDALIKEACQKLYSKAGGQWVAIPEGRELLTLNASLYWVATRHTDVGMSCTVVELKHYKPAPVLTSTNSSTTTAVDGPAPPATKGGGAATKGTATSTTEEKSKPVWPWIVMAIATFLAIVLPLLLGFWLYHRSPQAESAASPTLDHYQDSYLQVGQQSSPPRLMAVDPAMGNVGPLAGGGLLATSAALAAGKGLESRTALFANVEGFSAACDHYGENVVLQAYSDFLAAANQRVSERYGRVDQLVGDCLLATWGSLRWADFYAVEAALAVQTDVFNLHSQWYTGGVPQLRFRAGVHTGSSISAGFSERLHMLAGDSVRVARQLEAANKLYGTYLCVSGDVFQAAREHFHFRQLLRGAPPPQLYEVLCPVRAPDPSDHPAGDDASHLFPSRATTPTPQHAVYHWKLVEEAALLMHAQQYRAACERICAGDYPSAWQLLSRPVLPGPDRSWELLLEECRSYL